MCYHGKEIFLESEVKILFNVKFEDFERERLDEIFDDVTPFSQMQKNEKYFLNGAVRYLKPKNILEVGIAHGGGSAIILNAIKDIDGAKLISVDYCEKFYGKDIDKPSGYIVDEKFSHLKNKWTRYLGGDVSKFIEEIYQIYKGGGYRFFNFRYCPYSSVGNFEFSLCPAVYEK